MNAPSNSKSEEPNLQVQQNRNSSNQVSFRGKSRFEYSEEEYKKRDGYDFDQSAEDRSP